MTKKKKLKTYEISAEYRAKVRCTVDAANLREAEQRGMEETDEYVNGCLELYSFDVKEKK